jgi:hypothetical protein
MDSKRPTSGELPSTSAGSEKSVDIDTRSKGLRSPKDSHLKNTVSHIGASNTRPSLESPAAGPHQITRNRKEFQNQEIGPYRRPNCSNYSKCLDIAACLDWDSFTCLQCNGSIDATFIWQMRSKMKKDKLCQRLFSPPEIKTFNKKS